MRGSFYIASSRDGIADVATLAMNLSNQGMLNAFPWPWHFSHQCSWTTCGITDRKELAERELEAASTCDLFVGVSRLGKGSHVEFGAALKGKAERIILVGVVPSDLVFYEAMGVEIVSSIDDVIPRLHGWVPSWT